MTGQETRAAEAEEFVLGLLDDAEARALEARLAADPALAAAVAAARDRLLPLDLAAPPAALPPGFAERVRAAIRAEPEEMAEAAPDEPQAVAPPPNVHVLPAPPPRRWRLAALAAALGLAVGLGLGLGRPAPDPIVIAVLLDENGTPQAIVEDFGNETAQIRFVADIAVPADRAIELWTLPSPETGPVSLGVLTDAAAARLRGPALPRPAGDQLYEITLEPRGGSPTGRPTGPVLGKGLATLQES